MSGPPRPPWLYRFVRDRTGQSTVVGAALLLMITVMGTGLIVTLGGQAINQTQQSADLSRVEHSMSMFDSQAAMVALGETSTRSIQLGAGGAGSFSIEENAGWMRVTHHNYTEYNDTETIYNRTLGAVVYQNGQTNIAYQGGGVWRGRNGSSVMVSPPEFHYRAATLTLPVIRVEGNDSASGRSTAQVSLVERSTRVYPSSQNDDGADGGPGAPYDNTSAPYRNPVMNGHVTVTVHSDYYRGWANFFRTRTAGIVSVDSQNRTVTVELVSPGMVGAFQLPPRNQPVEVTGMGDGHALEEFTLTVDEGNNFNNMYFSFWAESGGQEFEILVHIPEGLGGNPCSDGTLDDDSVDPIEMDVYYHDESTSTGHHAWKNNSIPPKSGPIRMQCGGGGVELYVDFTSDTRFTYGSFSSTNDPAYWHHDWDGSKASSVDFDQHPADPAGNFTTGEEATLDLLVNHYFALFAPNMNLVVNYGPGGSPRVDVSASTGNLEYRMTTGGQYITYLHITENRIRVGFE